MVESNVSKRDLAISLGGGLGFDDDAVNSGGGGVRQKKIDCVEAGATPEQGTPIAG